MLNSKDKLKSICNYKHKVSETLPIIQMAYIDMINSTDFEHQQELKRQRRNLVIDVTLDETSISEYEEGMDSINSNGYLRAEDDDRDYPRIMSPMLKNITVSSDVFNSYDDIYDRVINTIDTHSKNNKVCSLTSTGIHSVSIAKSDDYDVSCRRIMTKLNLHSNIIAMDGRYGQATTVIVGFKNSHYFKYMEDVMNFKQFNVIYDYNMDQDKVILCRAGNIQETGILLIDNSQYFRYYLKETDKWDSQFSWFWIK